MLLASLAKNLSHVLLQIPHYSVIELVSYIILLIPTVYTMLVGAPFVPTQMEQVDRMLKAAKIKPGMKVYDLGCGDGRLVHKAAKKYKARAVGYEFSPLVWLWAKFVALFWRTEAKIVFADFWKKDLSDSDVIFCYLLPHAMKNFQERIVPQLKPGSLIVSHAFPIPDFEMNSSLPRVRERKLGPVWIYKI